VTNVKRKRYIIHDCISITEQKSIGTVTLAAKSIAMITFNTGTGKASRCIDAVSMWTAASVIHSTFIYVCIKTSSPTEDYNHIVVKRLKVQLDIYALLLTVTGKAEQQPFTIRNSVLTSTSSRQRSTISCCPLHERTLDP